MNWNDVAIKINKELVKFLRHDMRCSHILVGRKEYEEICKLENYEEICKLENIEQEEHLDNSTWGVEVVKVDEDSYLAGAYIPTQEELDAKRSKKLMKNNPPA